MPNRFWGNREEEKPDDDDIELKPKEVKEKLDKIEGLETKFSAFEEKSSKTLDRMSSYLDEVANAREAARLADEARKNAPKTSSAKTPEEIQEEWLNDPQGAAKNMLDPLMKANALTASRVMRRDMFDDGKEYEFYHGEFKKKVDAYIDGLPPTNQTDPAAIKNCYYLVLGQSQKEIAEGKLKSKFAAASTGSNGTGVPGPDSQKTTVLTDSEKKAAKAFGMTEADYLKRKDEVVYVS